MSLQKKSKRGKRTLKEDSVYFWHLAINQFERAYWWMEPSGRRHKLNTQHPELTGEKDEKGHDVVLHSPIIWEVLRRHPKVPEMRSQLIKLAHPRPLHDLLLSRKCRKIFADCAFEIELIIATCGLNGWCSKTPLPQNYADVFPGKWPLDGFPKQHFQSLINSFRHAKIPKQDLVRMCPVLDILTAAQTFASTTSRLSLLEESGLTKGDPFGILGEDQFTLQLVLKTLETRQQEGYKIAILAFDPEPTRRSQVVAEIETLLFKNQNSSSASRIPPRRRPRIEQLSWIYEVEQGTSVNKADYLRMVDNIQFPCLPCVKDPKITDSLAQRLERIEKMLKAI
jgi:hypothetical protein